MGKLALTGGEKVRTKDFYIWPSYDERELKYVEETIKSRTWFSGMRGADPGTKTLEFEEKFAAYHDAKYGKACANGTVAIEIALRAGGVGPGDEVIVPGLTFIATLSAVLQVNAVPVIVDSVFETSCIDPNEIEKVITERTKAIIPVHYGGFACDMGRIMEIAKKHNLIVIEDSAHAHGTVSKGRKVGAIGDMGTFSFQESKNMTAGEGGIVTTNNPDYAEMLDQYRSCGRHANESWYVHYVFPVNYRLAEVLSAMLMAQLEKLDGWVKQKNENAAYLGGKLKEIDGITPYPGDDNTDVNGLYMYLLNYDKEKFSGVSRNKIVEALNAEGIPSHIGYPWPLHKNPMFLPEYLPEKEPYVNDYYRSIKDLELPVIERLCAETIVIPHQVLISPQSDMDDIVTAFKKIKDNAQELA